MASRAPLDQFNTSLGALYKTISPSNETQYYLIWHYECSFDLEKSWVTTCPARTFLSGLNSALIVTTPYSWTRYLNKKTPSRQGPMLSNNKDSHTQ
jgi:hypothetical protein